MINKLNKVLSLLSTTLSYDNRAKAKEIIKSIIEQSTTPACPPPSSREYLHSVQDGIVLIEDIQTLNFPEGITLQDKLHFIDVDKFDEVFIGDTIRITFSAHEHRLECDIDGFVVGISEDNYGDTVINILYFEDYGHFYADIKKIDDKWWWGCEIVSISKCTKSIKL